MGRFIEGLAQAAGDEVVLIVDEDNRQEITPADLAAADVAIEFTRPESAIPNIELALEAGVPIVVGTTAPSGTGITLAERVGEQLDAYDSWALSSVKSDVPQTHIAPAFAPKEGKPRIPAKALRKVPSPPPVGS